MKSFLIFLTILFSYCVINTLAHQEVSLKEFVKDLDIDEFLHDHKHDIQPVIAFETFSIADEFSNSTQMGTMNNTEINAFTMQQFGYTAEEVEQQLLDAIAYVEAVYGLPLEVNTNPALPQVAQYFDPPGVPVALMFRYNVTLNLMPQLIKIWGHELPKFLLKRIAQYDFGYNLVFLQNWNDTEKGVFVPAGQVVIIGRYIFFDTKTEQFITVTFQSAPRVTVNQIRKSVVNGIFIADAQTKNLGLKKKSCVAYGLVDDPIELEIPFEPKWNFDKIAEPRIWQAYSNPVIEDSISDPDIKNKLHVLFNGIHGSCNQTQQVFWLRTLNNVRCYANVPRRVTNPFV